MKPLKQIIDEVKIDLKQFTDDNRINFLEEYIESKADDIRATLIRQDIDNRKGYASLDFYQHVCCLEVKCHERGCKIDDVFIPSGTIIWEVELPPLIEDIREYDLKYFGTDNFENPFTRLNLSGFRSVEGDKWNKKNTYFVKIGNVAWIKNLPSSGSARVCAMGIWQQPTKLCSYSYEKSMYPVPSDYQLKILLKRDILTSWGYIYEDKHNNNQDNSIIPPAAAKSNQQQPTDSQNDE
jgi:hypothetical protein